MKVFQGDTEATRPEDFGGRRVASDFVKVPSPWSF